MIDNIVSLSTHVKKPSIAQIECSQCGATADAACNCGAPYVPKAIRATEAITKSPEKSSRAIAEEIGVSESTVRRARESTASHDAVGKRTGKDGKVRKLPQRQPEPVETDDDVDPALVQLVADRRKELEEKGVIPRTQHSAPIDPADTASISNSIDPASDNDGAEVVVTTSFLVEAWRTALDRREVIQSEDVADLIELMSDAQRAALYDRLIDLQIEQAAPVVPSESNKKLLASLTGTFHWALGHEEPSSGAQAIKIINAKLAANKLDAKDICFAFVKKGKR